MHRITQLASCPVDDIEKLGWDGDLLEAHAFAYLAARVKVGLPTSFPTTTGVRNPCCGGNHAVPSWVVREKSLKEKHNLD